MKYRLTVKERDAVEEKIPGTMGWCKMKSQESGVKFKKKITRNSLYLNKIPTHEICTGMKPISRLEEAIDNGWVLVAENTWSHPQYEDRTFPSIFQTSNGRSSIPYGGHNDEKGLAYVIDNITCGGKHTKIKSNRWLSEEFNTRRGRRRNKFNEKKEEKKKFLSTNYKENMNSV